jgi:ribosome biogenesis GTPase
MDLVNLGFDHWFRAKFNTYNPTEYNAARVIEVNKNSYLIASEKGEAQAEPTGKFLFQIESSLDIPTVGDWVVVQYFDENTFATIHNILPRHSLLKRKDPGRIDYQLIAANVDYALIMQSMDADFNLNRLERYLVAANEGDIQPVILLSKSDLVSAEEREEKLAMVGRVRKDYPVIFFSNITGEGLDNILDSFKPGKTYCLLGSSGVGKTTLLNILIGEERFAVREVRQKDSRGRHVTSRRQLIRLENGSIIIDTPGMRELGNINIQAGLGDTFEDIYHFAAQCHFSDCTHTREQDCAVLEAIQNGELDEDRYLNFLKIQRESAFNRMSYGEKRKRDKEFGKMCKRIMKNHKKKQ